MAIQRVTGSHNEVLNEASVRNVLSEFRRCVQVEYKWERQGDILCLVRRDRRQTQAEQPLDKTNETIEAALWAGPNGYIEFSAADTLSPELISVCLAALTRLPGMDTLRLSGYLTEHNVPALCRLLEDSTTIRSLECSYTNLPVSLLEKVANSLEGNSSVARLEIVSDGFTPEHITALFKVIARLPRVAELNLVDNGDSYKHAWLADVVEFDYHGLRTVEIAYVGLKVHHLSSILNVASHKGSHLNELRFVKPISLTKGPSPLDILEEFQYALPNESRLEAVYLLEGNYGDSNEEWVVEWSFATGCRLYLNIIVLD